MPLFSFPTSSLNEAEATENLKKLLQLENTLPNENNHSTMQNGNLNHSVSTMEPHESLKENQNIVFQGNQDYASHKIFAKDVQISVGSAKHTSGSSKVQIKNIVDFRWEHKYYYGNLVAVHLSGNYFAYAIKALPGHQDGVVRVVSKAENKRILLKGMKGQIKDLAFAHTMSEVVLALIDEIGNVFIYAIAQNGPNMVCSSILEVLRPANTEPSDHHRLIWCPYIPDDNSSGSEDNQNDGGTKSSEDLAMLLAVTHNEVVEMWNVERIIKKFGHGPMLSDKITEGFQRIKEHTQPVVEAAFSPDGTALATASLDGVVKFFTVSPTENHPAPKCLHEWNPHSKPISSLFFIDDHKNPNPEVQFWRFAVTGAANNTEIKVWSCESWTCLQTVKFTASGSEEPCIKAAMDLTSNYLILSDITRKCLYVLQVHQDPDKNDAFVCSVAEFPLNYPFLSFAVTDAGRRRFKATSLEPEDQLTGDDLTEEDDYVDGVVIKLYLIQTKSLQKCCIAFQPNVPGHLLAADTLTSSLTLESLAFQDKLSELADEPTTPSTEPDLNTTPSYISANNVTEMLLTPAAFASPNQTPEAPKYHNTSTDEVKGSVKGSRTSECRNSLSQHSGGSSPSLEVQQILSPKAEDVSGPGFSELVMSTSNKLSSSLPEPSVTDLLASAGVPATSLEGAHGNSLHLSDAKSVPPPPKTWPATAPEMTIDLKRMLSIGQETRVSGDNANEYNINESIRRENDESREASKRIESMLLTVQQTIEPLSDVIRSQQAEIGRLQTQLDQQAALLATLHTNLPQPQNLEPVLIDNLEKLMKKYTDSENARVTQLLRARDEADKKTHDRLISAVSHTVSNTVTARLEAIVRAEFQSHVIPLLAKVMEPLRDQIRNDVAQKLTATDDLMKDNIGKLVKSRAVIDAISQNVGASLQKFLPLAFADIANTVLIPNYEKCSQTMFIQLNDIFCKGTKEYFHHLDAQFDRLLQQTAQSTNPLANQLQQVSTVVQTTSERLGPSVRNVLKGEMGDLQVSIKGMLEAMQAKIHDELAAALRQQQEAIDGSLAHVIRSRAVTPVTPTNHHHALQFQLQELIKKGETNSAFQLALSAADLQLVLYACDQLAPTEVFSHTPCVLQQNVLLSLIQQLSYDFNSRTDIKIGYIEEAIFHINPLDPLTKDHIQPVISSLRLKLEQYLQAHNTSKLAKNVRMLIMATHQFTGGK